MDSRKAQHAEKNINYADELIHQRKLGEAETFLINFLKEHPGIGEGYHKLAEVEWALGHRSRTILCLEQWLKIEPRNAVAWYRLASVYQVINQPEKAVEAFRKTTDIQPGNAANWVGLAIALLSAQMPNEAKCVNQHLCNNFSGHGMTHVINGHIEKMQGQEEAALIAYRKALELEPNLVTAMYNLVDLSAPAPDDPLTGYIGQLLQQDDMNAADKVNLHYSLGRIYDKAKQYDTAYTHYNSANSATLKEMAKFGIIYQPGRVEAFTQQSIQRYDVSCFQHPIEALAVDITLVFIVGLPRSGTTLIEQILAAHPQVTPGGELAIAQNVYQHYEKRRAAMNLGSQLDLTNDDEINLLLESRELFLDTLFERELEGKYISSKLPADFEILGFIRLLFPKAIIIHSQRSIPATCWSLYCSNFGMHDPYYNSMQHLAHYCRQYQKLMRHWEAVLEPAMISVSYEDLVRNSDEEIPKLIAGIQLPWNEACLRYYDNPGNVLTASYKQVRQPVYSSSVDRWRHYESYLSELTEFM